MFVTTSVSHLPANIFETFLPNGGVITANVGTEGATENFLIWTDFEFRD
jgi:hypothetical protein